MAADPPRPRDQMGLTAIAHRLSVSDGRYWAYVALGIPLGRPGEPYWDSNRHIFFNPWPAHWALQPYWAAT